MIVSKNKMAIAWGILYLSLLAVVSVQVLATDLSVVQQDQALNAGSQLVSDDGALRLAMQADGNLVLYDDRHITCGWWIFNCKTTSAVIWSTGLWRNKGTLPNRCVMQSDGNLVVYSSDGAVVWAFGHTVVPDPARPFSLKTYHTALSNSESATLTIMRYDPIAGWKAYGTVASYFIN